MPFQGGKDPNKELKATIDRLKTVMSTNNIYPITNYRKDSWWSRSVSEATFELLQQTISLAARRVRSWPECLSMPVPHRV